MHNLQIQYPEASIVEYHVNWPTSDPFNLHNPGDVNGRTSYYGVTGVPAMKADGKFPVSPQTLMTMYNNRLLIPSPISIELTGDYNEVTREGFVTVTMTAEEDISNDSYKLHVVLTETEIYYNTGGNDMHYNVMRDMMPSYNGTPVTLPVGVPVEETFNFTLPTGVNPPNIPPDHGYIEEWCRIVAFVQPAGTGAPNYREVEQSAWEWILDLTSTGADPTPARFAFEANYPNPFNPVTNIPVRAELSGAALLEILTMDGRLVTVLHEGELAAGEHSFKWDGTDDKGASVASGVYLARLTGQTEKHMQRMVLLK